MAAGRSARQRLKFLTHSSEAEGLKTLLSVPFAQNASELNVNSCTFKSCFSPMVTCSPQHPRTYLCIQQGALTGCTTWQHSVRHSSRCWDEHLCLPSTADRWGSQQMRSRPARMLSPNKCCPWCLSPSLLPSTPQVLTLCSAELRLLWEAFFHTYSCSPLRAQSTPISHDHC